MLDNDTRDMLEDLTTEDLKEELNTRMEEWSKALGRTLYYSKEHNFLCDLISNWEMQDHYKEHSKEGDYFDLISQTPLRPTGEKDEYYTVWPIDMTHVEKEKHIIIWEEIKAEDVLSKLGRDTFERLENRLYVEKFREEEDEEF